MNKYQVGLLCVAGFYEQVVRQCRLVNIGLDDCEREVVVCISIIPGH